LIGVIEVYLFAKQKDLILGIDLCGERRGTLIGD
jgi:hypothetical protein